MWLRELGYQITKRHPICQTHMYMSHVRLLIFLTSFSVPRYRLVLKTLLLTSQYFYWPVIIIWVFPFPFKSSKVKKYTLYIKDDCSQTESFSCSILTVSILLFSLESQVSKYRGMPHYQRARCIPTSYRCITWTPLYMYHINQIQWNPDL